MVKYYTSGLYEELFYTSHADEGPFYTAHCIRSYFSDDLQEQDIVSCLLKQIKYNFPLIARYYHIAGGVNYVNKKDMRQKIRSRFESDLKKSLAWHYYEPLVWDEKIALECDLVPFQFGE